MDGGEAFGVGLHRVGRRQNGTSWWNKLDFHPRHRPPCGVGDLDNQGVVEWLAYDRRLIVAMESSYSGGLSVLRKEEIVATAG